MALGAMKSIQIFLNQFRIHQFSIHMKQRRLCRCRKHLVYTVDHQISSLCHSAFRQPSVKAEMCSMCLIHDQGEARPVDIAARLGVKVPTVSKTLDRLAREGLITRAKYRSVFLTEAGRALAKECRRRHEIVLRFLISLGLDPETAERDAEGIEHHVSERTLALFSAFANRS